jgi:hypothetical protein
MGQRIKQIMQAELGLIVLYYWDRPLTTPVIAWALCEETDDDIGDHACWTVVHPMIQTSTGLEIAEVDYVDCLGVFKEEENYKIQSAIAERKTRSIKKTGGSCDPV